MCTWGTRPPWLPAGVVVVVVVVAVVAADVDAAAETAAGDPRTREPPMGSRSFLLVVVVVVVVVAVACGPYPYAAEASARGQTQRRQPQRKKKRRRRRRIKGVRASAVSRHSRWAWGVPCTWATGPVAASPATCARETRRCCTLPWPRWLIPDSRKKDLRIPWHVF